MRRKTASLLAVLAVAGSGCGTAEPAPKAKAPSLACVERLGRRDAAVAALDTVAPVGSPADGASRYVSVRFKDGESLAVSEWRDAAAADAAVQKYMSVRPALSLGASGTTPEVVEAFTSKAEIEAFKSCGIAKIEP